jgi:hypothetical protein
LEATKKGKSGFFKINENPEELKNNSMKNTPEKQT